MPLSSRSILLEMCCEGRLKSLKDCQNGFDSRIQTEDLERDKPGYKPQEGEFSQPAENTAQDSDASGQNDVAAGENEDSGVAADEIEESGVEVDVWSGLAGFFSGSRSSLQFTESVNDITLITASKG